VELAVSRAPRPEFPAWSLEAVPTPGARTIAQVSTFLNIQPDLTIKSLVVMAESGPVLALVRGDHQLHERKLQRVIGPFRTAHPEEVVTAAGVEPGFVGPVGANTPDTHLKGVVPGEHFQAEFADLREACPGDACAQCGAPLRVERVIEIGNIFKLGTKYSVPLRAVYLAEGGDERPVVMGSYGIGPARILAAAIEQGHDADGIVWPEAIAPFQVHLLVVNVREEALAAIADQLYRELTAAGIEVLYDDRDERPGVKFKDADLLGMPLRLTVGARARKEGLVEIRTRKTGAVVTATPAEVVGRIQALLGRT
jgi:prolyl-tRNA synthetase